MTSLGHTRPSAYDRAMLAEDKSLQRLRVSDGEASRTTKTKPRPKRGLCENRYGWLGLFPGIPFEPA